MFTKLDRSCIKDYTILMQSPFSRTEMLIGKTGMDKLAAARVAVFGVGGVGGYIAEALARSGIGALDLFDGDKVDATNINRQIFATVKTVGMWKTEAAAARLKEINPDIRIVEHRAFYMPVKVSGIRYKVQGKGENNGQWTMDNGQLIPLVEESAGVKKQSGGLFLAEAAEADGVENSVFANDIDLTQYSYIADAVDMVSAKIELAVRAEALGIPIISGMGAGNRLDAAGFIVDDIYNTSV